MNKPNGRVNKTLPVSNSDHACRILVDEALQCINRATATSQDDVQNGERSKILWELGDTDNG